MIRQVRIEKWVAGELVGSEEYAQHRTLYLPNEVRLMLQTAGFRDITLNDGYSDAQATSNSDPLLYMALK